MHSDPYVNRRRLTFEQAEGVEPIPTQLRTRELSEQLRSRIWFVFHELLKDATQTHYEARPSLNDRWQSILYHFHVFHRNEPADEFKNEASVLCREIKETIVSGNYIQVFGFIQFVLRHKQCPQDFSDHMAWALEEGRAAYRILDGDTIVPIASDEEQITLQSTFVNLAKSEFDGARTHLRLAAESLTSGKYADSVRESVHCVESVARTLVNTGQLSDALSLLEKQGRIHPALRRGFAAIYGYE